MDDQMIRQLLDRYFEGETSLQEEAQLRQAFQRDDLPQDLLPFQPLFCYFEKERTARLDQGFDQRLMQQIEKEPVTGQPVIIRRLSVQQWAVRIAAAIALMISVFWAFQPDVVQPGQEVASINWAKYEVEDPEEAFKITQSALLQASQGINQGTKVAAEEFDTKFRKVGQYFN